MHREEEIDEWIGSEGSLGIIVEAELLLLKKPNPFTSLFLFFHQEEEALEFSLKMNEKRVSSISDVLNIWTMKQLR